MENTTNSIDFKHDSKFDRRGQSNTEMTYYSQKPCLITKEKLKKRESPSNVFIGSFEMGLQNKSTERYQRIKKMDMNLQKKKLSSQLEQID